jgi:outer membrane immunogenic protein
MRTRWSTLAWAFALVVGSFSTTKAQTFSWNWTGFYVGADGGFVSNRSLSTPQASISANSYLTGGAPFTGTLATFNASAVDTLSARGFDAGGHAGFNWQLKPFAVGIEIDYGAFRTRATRDVTFALSPTAVVSQLHSEASTDWLFTARPRAGWVYSIGFAYVTGGIAVTGLSAKTTYIDNANIPQPNGVVSAAETKIGWTVGGGLELAIAPRWTVRAEYLHLEFPSVVGAGTITNPANGRFNPTALSADLKSDIVRVGVSHKFQWWFEPDVAPPPGVPVVVTKD